MQEPGFEIYEQGIMAPAWIGKMPDREVIIWKRKKLKICTA